MYTFPCNLCSVPFECVTNTSITVGAASEGSFPLSLFFFFKLSLAENACVTVWMEIAACSTCYEFYVAWDYSLKGFSGYSVKELCLERISIAWRGSARRWRILSVLICKLSEKSLVPERKKSPKMPPSPLHIQVNIIWIISRASTLWYLSFSSPDHPQEEKKKTGESI